MSLEDELENLKKVSRKFRDIDKLIQKQRKTVKQGFPFISSRKRPFGNRAVLHACFKRFERLECQALVGGVVYCVAETVCWRGTEK